MIRTNSAGRSWSDDGPCYLARAARPSIRVYDPTPLRSDNMFKPNETSAAPKRTAPKRNEHARSPMKMQ
jgi:hypothetical protein